MGSRPRLVLRQILMEKRPAISPFGMPFSSSLSKKRRRSGIPIVHILLAQLVGTQLSDFAFVRDPVPWWLVGFSGSQPDQDAKLVSWPRNATHLLFWSGKRIQSDLGGKLSLERSPTAFHPCCLSGCRHVGSFWKKRTRNASLREFGTDKKFACVTAEFLDPLGCYRYRRIGQNRIHRGFDPCQHGDAGRERPPPQPT